MNNLVDVIEKIPQEDVEEKVGMLVDLGYVVEVNPYYTKELVAGSMLSQMYYRIRVLRMAEEE